MTFEEAAGRYAELRNQLQAGVMDFADFQAAVARLTVVDPNGDWWQVDPATGEWLKWNGSTWLRPQAAESSPEAGKPVAQRQYSLLIQTQESRTELKPGGEDGFWVYASAACSDPSVDCAALAGAIQFRAGGANALWLTLSAPAPVAGAVAAWVSSTPPEPAATLFPGGASVVAFATLEGQAVTAEVSLQILGGAPVELSPVYWAFQQEPRQRSQRRTYMGQELAGYELVADGEDELNVAVIFVPDETIPDGADPSGFLERASNLVRLRKARLAGQCAEKYSVESSSTDTPGVFACRVKSRRPLLATEENKSLTVTLEIEGELPEGAADSCRLQEAVARVTLEPRLLFLKLIVVPSARPGASEAWAYAGTAGGTPMPLMDIACQIDLVAVGSGPQIALRGDAVQKTSASGVAGWTFDYEGVNWRNVGEARFKIRAGLRGPEGPPAEATWVEIDVNANGQKFLSDLGAAAGGLKLDNPAFGAREGIFASMWPESLLGPLNDAGAVAGAPGSWRDYISAELSDRIWRFALERRFASDVGMAASMNGIDFGKYEIAPIHVCCGFCLSGNDEPYFIDPWWEQAYHPDRVLLRYDPEKDRIQTCVTLMETVGPALLVKLGAVGSAAEGADAVERWLGGGIAGVPVSEGEETVTVCDRRFRVGKTALSREQWLNEDGSYREAPAGWGESFFTAPGSETFGAGTVTPLETW